MQKIRADAQEMPRAEFVALRKWPSSVLTQLSAVPPDWYIFVAVVANETHDSYLLQPSATCLDGDVEPSENSLKIAPALNRQNRNLKMAGF